MLPRPLSWMGQNRLAVAPAALLLKHAIMSVPGTREMVSESTQTTPSGPNFSLSPLQLAGSAYQGILELSRSLIGGGVNAAARVEHLALSFASLLLRPVTVSWNFADTPASSL